jgi:hypothetical protein
VIKCFNGATLERIGGNDWVDKKSGVVYQPSGVVRTNQDRFIWRFKSNDRYELIPPTPTKMEI